MADDTVPEEWRVIEGWTDYEVSSLGRVRRRVPAYFKNSTIIRVLAGKVLSRRICAATGRVITTLSNGSRDQTKTMNVHRLVCRAFHGAPPTPDHVACHGDGNKENNRADNLRWDTRRGNMADMIRHGTRIIGEAKAGAKLGDAQVREIRRLLAAGVAQNEVARRFGVRYQSIQLIRRGRNWRHVD